MDYAYLLRSEEEIKALLDDKAIVEAYHAMHLIAMCPIKLYGSRTTTENRKATYEAEVKVGFHYETEHMCIHRMEYKSIEHAC